MGITQRAIDSLVQSGGREARVGSIRLTPPTSTVARVMRTVGNATIPIARVGVGAGLAYGATRMGNGYPSAPLTPGTFPSPQVGMDTYGGGLTNTACNFISDARLRAACIALGGMLGGGGNGSTQPGATLAACPPGYKPKPDGSCQIEGIGGYIPGDVGMQDFGWGAVNGRFGAAYVPISVQRSYRACPPGSKLGKDGLCYDKLSRSNRMHDPGAKPFLTGGQVNTLRRAKSIAKRFAKLRSGKNALFPSARKCASGPKRRKR